jgi:hypothetical protein
VAPMKTSQTELSILPRVDFTKFQLGCNRRATILPYGNRGRTSPPRWDSDTLSVKRMVTHND